MCRIHDSYTYKNIVRQKLPRCNDIRWHPYTGFHPVPRRLALFCVIPYASAELHYPGSPGLSNCLPPPVSMEREDVATNHFPCSFLATHRQMQFLAEEDFHLLCTNSGRPQRYRTFIALSYAPSMRECATTENNEHVI